MRAHNRYVMPTKTGANVHQSPRLIAVARFLVNALEKVTTAPARLASKAKVVSRMQTKYFVEHFASYRLGLVRM